MNLVEKLIAVDKKEFDKFEKKSLPSRQLTRLLGEDAQVVIQAIDAELFMGISANSLDGKGRTDYSKSYDVNAKVAAVGIVEPDLKDKKLLEHLGVVTPAEAAKKIFKGEINSIAVEIADLSGFKDEEETEAEIKN